MKNEELAAQELTGSDNVVATKSFAFGVRIVKLCRYLRAEEQEFVLTKQLLRSGTSIGANVEEAIGGISKADFSQKISIAYKEARETSYWLRLLAATALLTPTAFQSIHNDCEELCKILRAILNTTRIKK